ncbi:hypothetical protein K432DRAFT_385595 [Lepidopterella palustris CBS 459.81]|uniref:Secreted protein n=1 Tax=Lepidopterella palustris CBS 459.81 TaxID=1314670 RepID=A0A8E2JB97_9PEZI|nr:hypothetical protein K432DRAFT_385595 [Lepidopterella palustris CBS 459.81]
MAFFPLFLTLLSSFLPSVTTSSAYILWASKQHPGVHRFIPPLPAFLAFSHHAFEVQRFNGCRKLRRIEFPWVGGDGLERMRVRGEAIELVTNR